MRPLALSIGLLFILGLSALLLPSCGTEYPLQGTISYRDARSGAKAGLVFAPGEPVRGNVKVPVYDQATGEVIGQVDLASGK
jgi:hypothetical protein